MHALLYTYIYPQEHTVLEFKIIHSTHSFDNMLVSEVLHILELQCWELPRPRGPPPQDPEPSLRKSNTGPVWLYKLHSFNSTSPGSCLSENMLAQNYQDFQPGRGGSKRCLRLALQIPDAKPDDAGETFNRSTPESETSRSL